MSKSVSNYGGNFQSDQAAAEYVGNRLEASDRAYNRAIQSGDNAKIAKAQIDNNKAQEQFSAYMKIKDKMHDTIMALIQQLGN